MNKKELAGFIDQTLLVPTATETQVKEFCKTAREYGFASVCINPGYVALAQEILFGSNTKVCTVIDFPLGAGGLDSKQNQADIAISAGADELDYVVNLGLVKSHEWGALEAELTFLVKSAREAALFAMNPDGSPKKSILTKLIIETCFLDDEEIVKTCECAKKAGFDFVKTSTGFGKGGATVEAVALMRKTVGESMGVKASGGIHSTHEALAMIEAGASRIGASCGVQIADGLAE